MCLFTLTVNSVNDSTDVSHLPLNMNDSRVISHFAVDNKNTRSEFTNLPLIMLMIGVSSRIYR